MKDIRANGYGSVIIFLNRTQWGSDRVMGNGFLFRFLCLFGAIAACQTVAADNPVRNIVLILADDLGWADTTLYGKTSLYETPNI